MKSASLLALQSKEMESTPLRELENKPTPINQLISSIKRRNYLPFDE
jgi:hypothetical protein